MSITSPQSSPSMYMISFVNCHWATSYAVHPSRRCGSPCLSCALTPARADHFDLAHITALQLDHVRQSLSAEITAFPQLQTLLPTVPFPASLSISFQNIIIGQSFGGQKTAKGAMLFIVILLTLSFLARWLHPCQGHMSASQV